MKKTPQNSTHTKLSQLTSATLREKALSAPEEFDASNADRSGLFPIAPEIKTEVLGFLARRPLHTAVLTGLLLENDGGSNSRHGNFYGYRGESGKLDGVALLGRATIFEARTEAALSAFASFARKLPAFRLALAENEPLQMFWDAYRLPGQRPQLLCNEWLYEYRKPRRPWQPVKSFRVGTMADLDLIVKAHAELVEEETQVNPLDTDPEGFRDRCAARVKQGKVWVYIKDGDLIFKADVATETPASIYIEGLWVNPNQRRQGYGEKCLEELRRNLCPDDGVLCGFVNETNQAANNFYKQVGCSFLSSYQKIYL
jgi:ribosomal protein S18 acetylase RimI-like enzyme